MKEFDFENKPIVDIANEIILESVKRGASDIHFDPYEDDMIIRMRIDGVLYDYALVPASHKRNMVSRIKMIASMNIMETRLPQDGAIKSRIGGRDIDLRVSSLPTYNGEKVVLRILDYSKSLQGLETLGFSAHNYEKIIKMTEIPNGIVLVTGATGSGKSTTVYSILQKLNTRDVNIITVEDPVEMDIAGLNQVQAQEEIGLDFATVLRSILRQDPDIIMIGEIRDTETARIAVRASITGHKVLSTIHTNNALNTIERLTDMDVERYLIGTSLNGIISQKLARKLCPYCRILRPTDDYERKLFKTVLHEDVKKVYDINKEGCKHCFKGYKNRTAIAEVLLITDAIRTGITTELPKEEMRKLVYIDGETRTLLEDGLDKVKNGETSFTELYKLVDIETDLAIHEKYSEEFAKKQRDIKNQEKKNENHDEVETINEDVQEEVNDEIKDEVKEETHEEEVVPILDLNNMGNNPSPVVTLDLDEKQPKDTINLDEKQPEEIEILDDPGTLNLDEALEQDPNKPVEILDLDDNTPKEVQIEETPEEPLNDKIDDFIIIEDETPKENPEEKTPEIESIDNTTDLSSPEDQELNNGLQEVPFVDETVDL